MSDNTMSDGLKKMLYTGIGIAAISVELMGKAVDSLAARGEEAIQRGRVLNEELKRKRAAAKANMNDIGGALEKMSKEELETIRVKVEEICKKWTDDGDKGAEG